MNEGTDLGNLRLDLCLLLLDLVFCLAGINASVCFLWLWLLWPCPLPPLGLVNLVQVSCSTAVSFCTAGKLGRLPVPVEGGPVSAPAACSVSVTYWAIPYANMDWSGQFGGQVVSFGSGCLGALVKITWDGLPGTVRAA